MKKHYVKLIVTLLVLSALLAGTFMIGASATVWEIPQNGSLEQKVLRADYNNGVMKLKIQKNGASATGRLSDFTMSKIPWKQSGEYMNIKEIYYGSGITSLKSLGMLSLDRAEIIHIPTSVTELGEIGRMTGLKTIYFGGTEKKWNELAEGITFTLIKPNVIFESNDTGRDADEVWEVGLYNVSDVVASRVGDTLYIEGRGEMKDYKLTPNGIEDLAPWVMNDNIKHVVVCDGVRNVGDYAFWNQSNVEDVEIAGSVRVIGEEAFYATGISKVVVPASVTEIRKEAFASCRNLIVIQLTQNVDTIGRDIFDGCENFATINYGGQKFFWDKINIDESNEELFKAKLVCNYVPENKPVIGGNKTETDPTNSPSETPVETPSETAGESTPEPTNNKKKKDDHTKDTMIIISFSVVVALLAVLILTAKKKKTEKS